MNTHARQVITSFVASNNLLQVWRAILVQFPNNPKVVVYMRENFMNLVSTFVVTITREMKLSDPMPGVTIAHQVAAYNRQFLRDRCDFIVHHVLGDERVPITTVTDGLPTARFGAAHYAQSADRILATWNTVATPGVQTRDDPAASNGRLQAGNYNPYHGSGDAHMTTGVVFCDQSELGTSQHMSQLLDNQSRVALNRGAPAYTETSFGNATPASDERLLQRRDIFRRNENGVENGVRAGEVRLQRRAIDRDIDETLHGDGEMSTQTRGYDMNSLYCRVKNKQVSRAFYE